MADTIGERCFEAELHRTQGEWLATIFETGDIEPNIGFVRPSAGRSAKREAVGIARSDQLVTAVA